MIADEKAKRDALKAERLARKLAAREQSKLDAQMAEQAERIQLLEIEQLSRDEALARKLSDREQRKMLRESAGEGKNDSGRRVRKSSGGGGSNLGGINKSGRDSGSSTSSPSQSPHISRRHASNRSQHSKEHHSKRHSKEREQIPKESEASPNSSRRRAQKPTKLEPITSVTVLEPKAVVKNGQNN